MKILQIILTVCVIALFSCSKEKLNAVDQNPNQLTTAPLSTLLPAAIMSTMHSYFGNNGNSAATFGAGVASEQVAFSGTGSIASFNFYATPTWENAYVSLRTCKEIEERSVVTRQWGYAGVANFLSALTLMNLLDLFGDVPYRDAFKPGQNILPSFDDDRELYNEVEALLDSSISRFGRATAVTSRPNRDDLVFNGNMTLWRKSAWALKARLYMRLINTDKQGYANKALTALQNGFAANESMTLGFFIDDNFNGNPVSIGYIIQSAVSISDNFVNTMKTFLDAGEDVSGDPRSRIWFSQIGGRIIAAPSGRALTDISLNGSLYSKPLFMRERRAPLPVITFIESRFIAAEANFILGNVQNAYNEYEAAVRASLVHASQFLPSNSLSQAEINNYVNRSKVLPGVSNLKLRDIIYQKYIFLFQFQQIEAYNEFRRTALFPVTDPLGHVYRFPYPQNEVSRNSKAPQNINDQTIYSPENKLFWSGF